MSDGLTEQPVVAKRGPGRPGGSRAEGRPKRVGLGQRGRLTYDRELLAKLEAQGLRPRLINDDPGRIQNAVAAGYQFVQSDGQIGEERVSDPSKTGANLTAHVGGGKMGYLMVLPKKWYDEDQKAKQEELDKMDNSMRSPKAKIDGVAAAYGPGLTDE